MLFIVYKYSFSMKFNFNTALKEDPRLRFLWRNASFSNAYRFEVPHFLTNYEKHKFFNLLHF